MFKIIPLGFTFFAKPNTNAVDSFIRAILSFASGEPDSRNSFETGHPDMAAFWHKHYNVSSHIGAAVQ